jgi:Cation efflux family
LENCVDFLSSAVVLWRFFAPESNPSVEATLKTREKRASVAISVILAILGSFIIAEAINDFLAGMEDTSELKALLAISISSIFVFGALSIIKFHYSIALASASLHKDGICSLIGTVLSAALFVNTLVIQHVPEAWWIDPAVALGAGIAALFIGISSIIRTSCIQKVPIFSLSWWMSSRGDGTDEINGRDLGPEDLELPPIASQRSIT